MQEVYIIAIFVYNNDNEMEQEVKAVYTNKESAIAEALKEWEKYNNWSSGVQYVELQHWYKNDDYNVIFQKDYKKPNKESQTNE